MRPIIMGKRSKYRAKATIIGGIKFPSKHEADRWSQLCLQQSAGRISLLRRQVPFQVHVTVMGGKSVGGLVPVFKYYADFTYTRDGVMVVEDAKGFKTPMYRLKKKCVEAQYGFKIVEV
jgi:hypothetical protein